MTSPPWTLRVYRLLVRLYPRRFREEYGPDLVGLVADQLRDEPTWRVLARSAVDLAPDPSHPTPGGPHGPCTDPARPRHCSARSR